MVASCRRSDQSMGGIELATHTCALTKNEIHNPSVHVPWLEPLSHTGQGWI